MSFYIELLANQRPFDIGPDALGRMTLSCNYDCVAHGPVASWEEEIVSLLHSAGLATLGVDCFIGSGASIPAGDGPFTTILNTGGAPPYETHNGDAYERLSVQVLVRAKSYTAARTRALAIWQTLHGTRNTTVAA